MEKRKTGARRRQAGRKRTAIVQDVLPIADVKGPYAIMKDGSRVGFLELPGINHSLYTEEQKKDEAYAMADVIASIPVEFASSTRCRRRRPSSSPRSTAPSPASGPPCSRPRRLRRGRRPS